MIKQAFILAAGYGTRMRPITDLIPKPMVEIDGQSIITRTLDKLVEYGIELVVINCFYKKALLKQHIDQYMKSTQNPPEIKVIEEDPLLETGGGIINAISFLKSEPFFVVNSDSIFVGENIFSYLSNKWDPKMRCLFLLSSSEKASGYLGKGDFDLNNKNQILAASQLNYAYPGAHITKKENFDGFQKEPIKLMKIYDTFKKGNLYEGFYGALYPGHWFHVDTPQAVQDTEKALNII